MGEVKFMLKYDFLFKGGRIVDPANNRDFIGKEN
jgi:endo-1,4-beta-D-glucanase Y